MPAIIILVASLAIPLHSIEGSVSKFRSPADLTVNNHGSDYHAVDSNLPFVAASGLTYVEMNHRESKDFLDRVYYLTDHEAAIRYAHATLFENESVVKETFHYPSHVESLAAFEAEYPKFLVLGTIDYPEDWLLRKLQADGDTVRLLGTAETSYKDKTLYEVTVSHEKTR